MRSKQLYVMSALHIALLVGTLCMTVPSHAQAASTAVVTSVTEEQAQDAIQNDIEKEQALTKEQEALQRRNEAIKQLRDVQVSLAAKTLERKKIAAKIKYEGESASEATLNELQGVDSDIELLNKTFEQIAIGGIDLSAFGVKEKQFDWREELVLIVKPLIENLKGLTEKPRKIEGLKRIITDKTLSRETTIEALTSIEGLLETSKDTNVNKKLKSEKQEWLSRAEELEREVQLAQYQLDSLQGKDIHWVGIVKQGASQFVSGRGLTLVLVIAFVILVWLLMRSMLWLARKQSKQNHDRSSKVRYRLAAYAYRLLTGLLIAITIMVVLYSRQDLLLLAIMVVLFVGAALALKNLLPKYVAEGRLLLNMGSVREKERIIYNGIPWEVSAINMYSRFTNPEIRGALRIPIYQMHEMISRPWVDESWFPSSEGDWVLKDSTTLIQVVAQTPDTVSLRDRNAFCSYMTTADYYEAGFANITRAKVFRVAVTFGIDYATQNADMAEIEAAFTHGMEKSFAESEFSEYLKSVRTEFHSAGDSSLNYVMLTTFDSAAAGFYNRIKRRINRACVIVCTENEWPIPFPQMSIHVESTPEVSADQSASD